MKFILTLIIVCMFLSACALRGQVRVIKTAADAHVYTFNVEPGDMLLCDKEACRVVRQ